MTDSAQGNAPPNGAQGTDTPQGSSALSEERVTEIVNRAISGRLAAEDKKLTKRFEEHQATLLTQLGSTLDEKFAAFGKPPPAEGAKPKDKDGAPAELKLEEHPEFKALREKTETTAKALAKAQKERDAEIAKRRESDLRSSLTNALTKHGVQGAALKIATGHLIDSAKHVGFGDDDAVIFKAGDEVSDLDTGLTQWLKTDEGKHFLPPRGASGSGERPRGPTSLPEPSKDPRAALADAVARFQAERG